jgi:integrase
MHKECIRTSGPRRRKRSGFPKTDLRYWRETIHKPVFQQSGRKIEAKNWAASFQYRGERKTLSLGTDQKEAAASRARDIYVHLQANGWESTMANPKLASFRPEMAPKTDLTVGEFLELVREQSDLDEKTVKGYARALRRIVSELEGIDGGKEKFDYHSGGHAAWQERVDSVRLSRLTPERIQKWKKAFLARAKRDPISQRRAKVSVNSALRLARSLFSQKKVLRHLGNIELPEPLPFANLTFEKEPSLEYKSTIDVRELIGKAQEELAQSAPELFKAFLLAVMVGLRRKEIDLLEWSAFRWSDGSIAIEPTEFFAAKSEKSYGQVTVDPEIMEIFRGYRARATSDFVIESTREPKPGARYQYWRCEKEFDRLTRWLREKGIRAYKPLHTLRKEFGSLINAEHGVHAASQALRHADIRVTSKYYLDNRRRVTTGLGHLLAVPGNVVRIEAGGVEPPNVPQKESPRSSAVT